MRIAYALAALAAFAGAVMAALAFSTPDSGVDGTPGAGLALAGAAAVAVGALVAMAPGVRGGWRGLLVALLLLGAVLTALAAWFLMRPAFAVAMAAAALLVLVAPFVPSRRRPA